MLVIIVLLRFFAQVPGGDSVQSDPRPKGLPVLRRARLQGHVLPEPSPRPAVHVSVQHARRGQLAVRRGRLADEPFRPDATHVHILPGLGRLQLHLQGGGDGQRRHGQYQNLLTDISSLLFSAIIRARLLVLSSFILKHLVKSLSSFAR